MIVTYKECIDMYGSNYQLAKAIEDKNLFRVEAGIYSTDAIYSDLEVIVKKYPNSILTSYSAFYYHGLTDWIPDKYHLATKSKAAKLLDERVVQIYVRDDLLNVGVINENIHGVVVKMYDKERMLIEVLRNKNVMPYDIYKEIIGNYRIIIDTLEIWRIQEYVELFPKSKMIRKALEEEVF